MNKNKLAFSTIIILLLTIVFIYNENKRPKLTVHENEEIVTLVESYYNNMMEKDYKGALGKVDLSKEDYNENLLILNSRIGYTIQQGFDDTHHWMTAVNGSYDYVAYDVQSKSFVVKTAVKITYKGKTTVENQLVFIKSTKGKFKIKKITAPEKYYDECTYILQKNNVYT